MDLITACDCRYATRDAFFSVHETAIGMTADVGTTPPREIMPEGWASDVLPQSAWCRKGPRYGLISEVYDSAEQILDAVMNIARQITTCAVGRFRC